MVAVAVAPAKDVYMVGVCWSVNSRVKLHVVDDVLRCATGHFRGDVCWVTRVELIRASVSGSSAGFVMLGRGGRFLGRGSL